MALMNSKKFFLWLFLFICFFKKSITQCPSYGNNIWCTCYVLREGLYLECPTIPLQDITNTLIEAKAPVQSISIYGVEMNTVIFPPFVLHGSITKLQISHSDIEGFHPDAFTGLENSLESLSVVYCRLKTIPFIAIKKLALLTELNLESNSITTVSDSFLIPPLSIINLRANNIENVPVIMFKYIEEVVTDINFIDNRLIEFPFNSIKNLANLKLLKLSRNKISHLTAVDNTFLNVQILDISNNIIQELTDKSLLFLPHLSYLSVGRNELRKIHPQTFKNNEKLESLILERNKLTQLDNNIFRTTPNLKIIDFSFNAIGSIENCAFCYMGKLEELFLSNNWIPYLTRNTFKQTNNVRVLVLEHNAIQFIDSETFSFMKSLEVLILNHNYITELQSSVFHNNINLQLLSMSNNIITELHDSLLFKASFLKRFYASDNQISHIGRDLFSNSLSMDEILLQRNNITTIAPGAFANLRSLEMLILNYNPIFILSNILPQSSSLTAVSISSTSIENIRENSFHNQFSLRELRLTNSFVRNINAQLFKDLYALRKLNLDNNLIQFIETGSFAHLRSLECLSIRNNNINTLNLDGLSFLKELFLTGNKIDVFSDGWFRDLQKLLVLDLSGNFLKEIPSRNFRMKSLKRLILSNNRIHYIEKEAFSDLPALHELDLSENELYFLERGAISNPSLLKVDLSGNMLTDINHDLFINSPNLEDLKLERNDIERISQGPTIPVKNLRKISLKENSILWLPENLFSRFEALREIDLSYNELDDESCFVFSTIKKLTDINLSGNSFKKLCSELLELQELKMINVSYTKIKIIPESPRMHQNKLTTVDFSNSRLDSVPWHFLLGSKYGEVNLAYNKLSHITQPANIAFESLEIKQLNLSSNPIIHLPAFDRSYVRNFKVIELDLSRSLLTTMTTPFSKLFSILEKLTLSQCKIDTLYNASFRGFVELRELDLSQNIIKEIPLKTFEGLNRLKFLNISRNQIHRLRGFSWYLGRLEELDSSYNKLSSLSRESLSQLLRLKSLHLQHNQIKEIKRDCFMATSNLEYLNLEGNKLITVQPDTFLPLRGSLKTLKIRGNPIRCYCWKSLFMRWMEDNYHLFGSLENPSLCRKRQGSREIWHIPSTAQICFSEKAIKTFDVTIRNASHDLELKWTVEEHSPLLGFKITYETNGESINIKEWVGPLSKNFKSITLSGLDEKKDYKICIYGIFKSIQPQNKMMSPASCVYVGSSLKILQSESQTRKLLMGVLLGGLLGLLAICTAASISWWYCRTRYRKEDIEGE